MSTLVLNNPGNVPTDRWQMILTPTATTIKLKNSADEESPLVLYPVTAALVIVECFTRTVLADAVLAYQLITPGSGWPFLYPGINTLTITGATGTFRFHPLYV